MLLNRARAIDVMREYQVDAIVASYAANVNYMSGYRSLSQNLIRDTQVYAVITADEEMKPVVVAPIGDLDCMADKGPNVPVEAYGTFPIYRDSAGEQRPEFGRLWAMHNLEKSATPLDALARTLKKLGVDNSRIAVDTIGMTPSVKEELAVKIDKAQIIEGYGLLKKIRMVKTPEEISRLRESARITERAIDATLRAAQEGMSELEMQAIFNRSIVSEGAMPLLTCIGIGSRSSMINTIPSEHKLRKGDLIRFDVGCVFESYCSDIARIASFGTPSTKAKEYYQAVLEGEQAAISIIKPGTTAADVFDRAVEVTRAAGIPHYDRHHCGHGIGIECYDLPSIAAQDTTVLKEGMVVNVETPYYELGFAGLQVEDTIVVTKDGVEYLSTYDRSLQVI